MSENDATPAVDEIYHLLRRGLGHEHVNAANVDELLQLAQIGGDTVLAEELREFKSDNC